MKVLAGSTNVSVYFYIQQDASGTSPGEPVTGLLFSDIETGGSASYMRQGAARVDLTLVTLASASAAHTDGGFILVDDTNMPGVYRCDYPDAAFATGVDITICSIVVASGQNAVAAPLMVEIDDSVVQTGDSFASVTAGVTVTTNNDKTGYALTQTFPTNFADLSISATTGLVDITQTAADKAWGTAARTLTAGTNIVLAKGVGVTGFNDLSAAQVNAEVLDVINVDTFVESSGVPAATASIQAKITWLYTLSRNKGTQTSTTKTLRNDADSADIATSTVSDDGTTFTRGEYV